MLTLKIINEDTHEVCSEVLNPAIDREWLIGRTPHCSLRLNSPEVSRVHGRILYREGQYFFTDLGSTDGSRLNNEILLPGQDVVLQADDLLRICEFFLVFKSIEADTSSVKLLVASDWQSNPNLTVRCINIIPETDDVKTFQFVAEPRLEFDYLPGQFVTVELPIQDSSGNKTILRSYSISSTPSRPHLLAITVKRVTPPAEVPEVPPGLASNWLHDHLNVGSKLQLKGPFGQFTCGYNPPPKLLLISAGSGITPMMSMTRWICDTAAETDIVFIYSARSPRDIIFRKELELLTQQHPNLRLAVTTTRSQPGDPWLGYQGRIDAALVQAIAPDFGDREVFVCGPNPFMAAIKDSFDRLGFPSEQYHEESFGASVKSQPKPQPKSQPKPQPNSQPESQAAETHGDAVVVFSQSAQTVTYDEEDSILEIAERANIAIPNACRMGVCGACKQALSAGQVHYMTEPAALNPADGDRFVLPCIARPIGRVVIEA